ncbi:tRNA pseudouridine(55) synthase TruB [Cyanobium sp. Aljojuca 7D2]|uniref:tRNA pseudouridine(55) synthase TruB n=1 Tax=Cyanobium sp. Aljojuca 7D2 TaxID=2823698 RepID=UPI0020CE75D5|nr:tRNA pseudouridine(55) synthase TruB [Cyanobium sp. Aljojuca 7D2]MCP9891278.1 tRNA pseudouridine(55) synthase TruB [Cyanobium sp. Aljojuca 7D2]
MADQPCGFLVLDKAAGLTSHACVGRVRRAYSLRRVGHGGTLDPAVTGVLPIALGPATRLLPYLEGDKTYRGVVQLGVRTVSDDLEGEVLARAAVPALTAADLEAALAAFRGTIQQVPPQVSAVHVDGQRAYARVRQGEQLQLAARPVIVQKLELLGWDAAAGSLELLVRCTAGTYIRALARDLGEALGCGGALARLRRTEALGFSLEQAVPLEQLDQAPLPALLDPLAALAHLPRRQLDEAELESWRCGRALAAGAPLEAGQELAAEQPVAVLAPDGNLAGMARSSGTGLLQPKLVFNATG